MDLKEANILNAEDPLSKAIHILLKTGTAVFVEKNGKIIGLVDDRNIKRTQFPERTKLENVCVRCPTLDENADLKTMVDAFLTGHFKALPYKKDNVIYELSRADLMRELLSLEDLASLPAKEIMSSPVVSVNVAAKIVDAKRLMREGRIHRLVVVDDAWRVVGVFSTFDLLGIAYNSANREGYLLVSQMENIEQRKIKDVMREDYISVPLNSTVKDVMEKMAEHNVSSVLVMDGPRVAGIISARDILRRARRCFGEQWRIRISGLDEDTLYYHPIIKDMLQTLLKKFSKTLTIERVHIRVKEGKSVYELNAHMHVNNKLEVIKAEGHTMDEAIDRLHDQMKRVLERHRELVREHARPN